MRELIIGEQFGNWTVIADGPIGHERSWQVKCSCGYSGLRRVSQLVRGRTSSCRTCAAKLREHAQRHYKLELSPHILSVCKTHAVRRNIPVEITFEDILDVWRRQGGFCKYSGVPLTYKPHQRASGENTASIDRIDSTKGYVKGNIQFVHKRINSMKNDMSEEVFIEWCRKVFSMACTNIHGGSCGV